MSAPPVREDVRPGWRNASKFHTQTADQDHTLLRKTLRKDSYLEEQSRLRQQSLLQAQRAGVRGRSPAVSASGIGSASPRGGTPDAETAWMVRRGRGASSPPRVAIQPAVIDVLGDFQAIQQRADELQDENYTLRAQLAQLARRSQRADSLEAQVNQMQRDNSQL